jgi:hypothetical protein
MLIEAGCFCPNLNDIKNKNKYGEDTLTFRIGKRRRSCPGRRLLTRYTVVNDRIRCRIQPYTCRIRSLYDRISP